MVKKIWSLVRSLLISIKKAIVTDPEVESVLRKYPRFSSFIRQRFQVSEFGGLTLTLLILVVLYLIFSLAGIIEGVVNSDLIVAVDVRLENLLFYFRNLSILDLFFVISVLGKTIVVTAAVIIFSIFLWVIGRKTQIFIFWFILIGSQFFVFLGKMTFHRSRPIVASYLETSASFPSAHAAIAVVLFGFISYVVWRSALKRKIRVIVVSINLLIIFLVGFSRLYLGVHFFSDVWAGYLVGFLWLAFGVSLAERRRPRQKMINFGRKFKLAGVILLLIFLVFYSGSSWYYLKQFKPSPVVAFGQNTVADPLVIFNTYNLNKYSETLTGTNQEPISFIIIAADDDNFMAYFRKSGWFLADQVGLATLWQLAKSAVLNQDYPAAPLTPDFWNGQVHNFGWEKDTNQHSVRQRHHARFWRANFKTPEGKSIYVGTASLDTGIKWLVTHQISPDVDTERELIFQDLQNSGVIDNFKQEKFVNPILGQNFSGDPFFTDGQVYLLEFK